MALYCSCFSWLDKLDLNPGLASLCQSEETNQSISNSIGEIDRLFHEIEPQTKYGHLFSHELLEEINAAREELTDEYLPPINNPEFVLSELATYSSAFLFVDRLRGLFSESILRWLGNIKRLINSPHNCAKRLIQSTVGHELQFVLGRFTMLPYFDWPDEVIDELIRECVATDLRRKSGKSWQALGLETETPKSGSISRKVQKALGFIKEKGPVRAKDIAAHLEIEKSSFHRHYYKPLKLLGVSNDRETGYRFIEE